MLVMLSFMVSVIFLAAEGAGGGSFQGKWLTCMFWVFLLARSVV